MIQIKSETISNIPCLIIEKKACDKEQMPLVIYLHGIGREKEDGITLAYLLAKENIRVVLPDSLYHGENKSNQLSEKERRLKFWEIIFQTVEDVNHIREYFLSNHLIEKDKIAIAGMSMGAIATGAALTQYDWIRTAGLLMGTPYLTKFAEGLIEQQGGMEALPLKEESVYQLLDEIRKFDLSKQKDCLQNRPLFFWHGSLDEVVPIDGTRIFYQELQKKYDNEQDLLFVEEKRGHYLSYRALKQLADWFVSVFQKI